MITYDFFKLNIYTKQLIFNYFNKKIFGNEYFQILSQSKYQLEAYAYSVDSVPNLSLNNEFTIMKEYLHLILMNENKLLEESGWFELKENVIVIYNQFYKDIEFPIEIIEKMEKKELIIIGIGLGALNLAALYFNYTFFPYGWFNSNEILNDQYLLRFKHCLNLGYNSNADDNFYGFHIGIPVYNCFYANCFFKFSMFDLSTPTLNFSNTIKKQAILYLKELYEVDGFISLENPYILNVIDKFNLKNDYSHYSHLVSLPDFRTHILSKIVINKEESVIYLEDNNHILVEYNSKEFLRLFIYQNVLFSLLSKELSNLENSFDMIIQNKLNFYFKEVGLFNYNISSVKELNLPMTTLELIEQKEKEYEIIDTKESEKIKENIVKFS